MSSKYTRDELLGYLEKLADELGKSPTVREMDNAEGFPSERTYIYRFGSWNKAKKEAGLETWTEGRPEKHYTYSDEELLDMLRRLDDAVEDFVSQSDINQAEEYPCAPTYRERFGSWNQAKEKAGLLEE